MNRLMVDRAEKGGVGGKLVVWNIGNGWMDGRST